MRNHYAPWFGPPDGLPRLRTYEWRDADGTEHLVLVHPNPDLLGIVEYTAWVNAKSIGERLDRLLFHPK